MRPIEVLVSRIQHRGAAHFVSDSLATQKAMGGGLPIGDPDKYGCVEGRTSYAVQREAACEFRRRDRWRATIRCVCRIGTIARIDQCVTVASLPYGKEVHFKRERDLYCIAPSHIITPGAKNHRPMQDNALRRIGVAPGDRAVGCRWHKAISTEIDASTGKGAGPFALLPAVIARVGDIHGNGSPSDIESSGEL